MVVRSLDGNWIKRHYRSVGIATNLEAELHAILNGFRYFRVLNSSQSITCFSDSLEAVRTVMVRSRGMPPFGSLLLAIKNDVR